MLDFSGYTHSECFRVNGALPDYRIESLLDYETRCMALNGAGDDAQEIAAGFVDEGFLSDAILRLETMARALRGANKAELLDIAEQLREVESSAVNAAEYGAEKLAELKAALQ
jgi:hypothetical protein